MGNEPGLAYQNGAMPQAESQRPYYQAVGNEETVFKAAYRQGLSLVLKGPTGCGKTRFVEAMAHDLGQAADHCRLPRRPHHRRPGRQVPVEG